MPRIVLGSRTRKGCLALTHISELFYECTPEIHAGLGAIHAADGRFRSNIDKAGEGLAEYLSATIAARYTG
ncbi:MAG: TipAS antibiotic-recognition domain-containing protein [Actinomycetota bacterium]